MSATAILPTPGSQVVVQWDDNPKGGVKSNRVGDSRTRKVVLVGTMPSGTKPRAGQTWLCEVERVTNQRSENRGAIVVKPLTLQIDLQFQDVWVDPTKAKVMAAVLQDRRTNLFLQGPQGVGKSTIARCVMDKLGWRFRKIEGSQIKKHAFMYGRYVPKPTHTGTFGVDWEDSALAAVVREAQKFPEIDFGVMIDEYTRIDEDARDAFLGVIEGVERAIVTTRPETIAIPNNIHWMAAGNVGGEFTVKMQDAANMDRFVVVEITHMPLADEIKHCFRRYPTCPKGKLDQGLGIIDKLRRVIQNNLRLANTISTRQAENMTMLLAAGLDLDVALKTAVANQFSGRIDNTSSDRGRVAEKISLAIKGHDIENN